MISGVTTIELTAVDNASAVIGRVKGASEQLGASYARLTQLLGALGVGLSVGYFTSLVKGSIDALDHLQDLSKSTNILVEDLAGLGLATKQSGGDLDSIAASINKLSVNMGKDAEKFAALGISAKSPLEAFKQLSDIYVAIEDPQLRAAVAAAALGKSWAGAAPLLAEGGQKIGEMVERGRELTGVTQEMTRQADEFNDKLVELTGGKGMLTRQVGALLPLLNAFADKMLGMQDGMAKSSESGTVLSKTLATLAQIGAGIAYVFDAGGKKLGSYAAQLGAFMSGNWSLVFKIAKESDADIERVRQEYATWIKQLEALGDGAKKTGTVIAGVDAATRASAAARAKAFIDADKEAKDLDATYRNLKKSLQEKLLADREQTALAKLQLDLDALSAKQRATITPEREKELKDLAARADLLKTNKAAMEAYIKAQEQLADIEKELAEARAKDDDKRKDAIESQDKVIDQIEFETRLIGISNEQRQIAIAMRALETSGIEKQDGAYTMLAKKIYDALQAQQATQAAHDLNEKARGEFLNLWSTVENTGKQAFIHLMSEGKSAFESIGKSIKTAVIDMLYQLTARKWMISIGAGMETALYGASASAATNTAAGSTLGSFGGSLVTGGAGVMSQLGTGLSAWGAGGSVMGVLSNPALYSGLELLGTAIPIIGGGLIALNALGVFDKGGPKNPQMWLANDWPTTGSRTGSTMHVGQSNFASGQWNLGDNPALYASFYEPIDKWLAQLPKKVQDAIAGMGVEMSPSDTPAQAWAKLEAQVLSTAKSLDLTTEEMRHLAPLAEQAAYANQVAASKRELELKIMELSGNAAEAVAARRTAERAAMDESLRPLQDRIWDLEDEAARTAKASELTRARNTLEIQIMELEGNSAGALALQRQIELAAMDQSLRPLQERVYALQDEKTAADAAAQAAAEAARATEQATAAMERQTQVVQTGLVIDDQAYRQAKADYDLASMQYSVAVQNYQTGNATFEQVQEAGKRMTQAERDMQLAMGNALNPTKSFADQTRALTQQLLDLQSPLLGSAAARKTERDAIAEANLALYDEIQLRKEELRQRDLLRSLMTDEQKTYYAARQIADMFKLLNSTLDAGYRIEIPRTREGLVGLYQSLAAAGAPIAILNDAFERLIPLWLEVEDAGKKAAEASKAAQDKAAQAILDTMQKITALMDSVKALGKSIGDSILSIKRSQAGWDEVAYQINQVALARTKLTNAATAQEKLEAAGGLQSAIMARYNAEVEAARKVHEANEKAAREAIESANRLNAAYRSIGDYAKSLLIGQLSPLSPEQQFQEAQRQYQSTLAKAKGGDLTALGQLSGVAGTYLEQARGMYGSAGPYASIFADVQGTLDSLGAKAGIDQVYAENTAAWQASLLSIQTQAMGELSQLAGLVDLWQSQLDDRLTDQAIAYTEIVQSLDDIRTNTKDLDKRIGEAFERAINAKTRADAAIAEAGAKANDAAIAKNTGAIERLPRDIASAVDVTTRR